MKYKLEIPKLMNNYQIDYRNFEGTIIDLKSDGGPFLNYLDGAYRYSKHQALSVGIMDEDNIEVIAKTFQTTPEQFAITIEKSLGARNRPYYAFNAEFDMAILSDLLRDEIVFDREIKVEKETKEIQVKNLRISNFDDPFRSDDSQAGNLWKKHLETQDNAHIYNIIAHNRASVLKEYYLLLNIGYKSIEQASCNNFFDGKNGLRFGCHKKL